MILRSECKFISTRYEGCYLQTGNYQPPGKETAATDSGVTKGMDVMNPHLNSNTQGTEAGGRRVEG